MYPGVVDNLLEVVNSRWEFVHYPLHYLAYVLDPEYHSHLKDLEPDGGVMTGFRSALWKLLTDNEYTEATSQFSEYQLKQSIFSRAHPESKGMRKAAQTMHVHNTSGIVGLAKQKLLESWRERDLHTVASS